MILFLVRCCLFWSLHGRGARRMRMQLRGVTQLSYSWSARVGGQASKIRHALSPKFQHTISRSLHRRVRGEGCGRAGAKGVRARWARQDLLRQPLSASSSARGGLRLSGSQGCSCKRGPAKAFCSCSIAAFLARLMVQRAGAKGVRARWAQQDLFRQPSASNRLWVGPEGSVIVLRQPSACRAALTVIVLHQPSAKMGFADRTR